MSTFGGSVTSSITKLPPKITASALPLPWVGPAPPRERDNTWTIPETTLTPEVNIVTEIRPTPMLNGEEVFEIELKDIFPDMVACETVLHDTPETQSHMISIQSEEPTDAYDDPADEPPPLEAVFAKPVEQSFLLLKKGDRVKQQPNCTYVKPNQFNCTLNKNITNVNYTIDPNSKVEGATNHTIGSNQDHPYCNKPPPPP